MSDAEILKLTGILFVVVILFMALVFIYLLVHPASWLGAIGVIASGVIILVSINTLTPATLGVGIGVTGCWLAIAVRIMQADELIRREKNCTTKKDFSEEKDFSDRWE